MVKQGIFTLLTLLQTSFAECGVLNAPNMASWDPPESPASIPPLLVQNRVSSGLVELDHGSYDVQLKKLDHTGVRGVTLKWFKSYHNNRKQLVDIVVHASNPTQLHTLARVGGRGQRKIMILA